MQAPDWTQSLELNQAAILSEMGGLVPGADETLDPFGSFRPLTWALSASLALHPL